MSPAADNARRRQVTDAELSRQTHGTLAAAELAGLRPDAEEDARGTFCPEPVIRTQNRMREMERGAVLLLLADDGGVEVDIPAWCISTRNEFLGIIKQTDFYRVFVRKG